MLVDRSADGDADAEVAGEPSELFLWLWGRADASSLVMTGDSAAVSDLRGRLVEATG